MDIITLDTISWSAPEYVHKEHSIDFLWGLGLVTLIACGIALWVNSYLFAVFILISGACLILFTIHKPKEMEFMIETNGLTIDQTKYEWKNLKGFTIKQDDPYAKLLIMTSRYFLPVFTIPVPLDIVTEVRDSLLQVVPVVDLQESPSVLFMEKIGF